MLERGKEKKNTIYQKLYHLFVIIQFVYLGMHTYGCQWKSEDVYSTKALNYILSIDYALNISTITTGELS